MWLQVGCDLFWTVKRPYREDLRRCCKMAPGWTTRGMAGQMCHISGTDRIYPTGPATRWGAISWQATSQTGRS